MTKIAVLGASGQLGTSFVELLGEAALPVTRKDLDLSELTTIAPWIEDHRPHLIINCAAYTAVDHAESDEMTAWTVNARAVRELAEAAQRRDVRLVSFSTDYVFDGAKSEPYVESDEPNPQSAYGRTKLEGERLALGAAPTALLVRTSWLLSGTHQNFASTILRKLRRGSVDVVDDQWGRPTIVTDLAPAVMQCVEAGLSGMVHLTNAGETTWFGLARELAAIAGLDPTLVRPVSSATSTRHATRPANSVLASELLEGTVVEPLPHYRESLPAVVAGLAAKGF